MKTFSTGRKICVLLYGFSFFTEQMSTSSLSLIDVALDRITGGLKTLDVAEGWGAIQTRYRPFQKLSAWFCFSGSCWNDLTAVEIILISTWREWLVHREGFSLFLAGVRMHHVLLPFRLADYFAAGNNKQRRKQAHWPSFKGTIYHGYHVSFIMSGNEICGSILREREKSPTITKPQDNPKCSQGHKEIHSD